MQLKYTEEEIEGFYRSIKNAFRTDQLPLTRTQLVGRIARDFHIDYKEASLRFFATTRRKGREFERIVEKGVVKYRLRWSYDS